MEKKKNPLPDSLKGQKLYIKGISKNIWEFWSSVITVISHEKNMWQHESFLGYCWQISFQKDTVLKPRGVMTESYFCFVYAYAIRKDVKYTQMDSKHFNIDFKSCNCCICRQQTIIFRHVRMLAVAFILVFQSVNIFMHSWNDSTQETGIIDSSLTAFSSQRKIVLGASCLYYVMPSIIWQMPILLLITW